MTIRYDSNGPGPLNGGEAGVDVRAAAALLRDALDRGLPVAALTGAGVSAESGIPTFRGAGGLWKGYRAEELATPEAFRRDPAKVWEWYEWRRGIVLEAEPNPAHKALAALERRHSPFTLITQNVDGLHQRAGSSRVVELHGNIHHARCTGCGHVQPLGDHERDSIGSEGDEHSAVHEQGIVHMSTTVQEEHSVPAFALVHCERCGAPGRPHIVWFGEMLPERAWREATASAASTGVLLVIGTSAAVYPAAGLVDVTLAEGGSVIEINPQRTDLSARVTFALREQAGIVLPVLLREAGASA